MSVDSAGNAAAKFSMSSSQMPVTILKRISLARSRSWGILGHVRSSVAEHNKLDDLLRDLADISLW